METASGGSSTCPRWDTKPHNTITRSYLAEHGVAALDSPVSGGVHGARAVLPRTFDYGFATGLMVKDVRLYLDEAKALDVPTQIADAVGRLWESTLAAEGPESDFTSVVKPIEKAAGVVIGRTNE
jgi:3-hydroxyisobutyrate dehydrogenase-like beta-hydroxyacid dehydrogenase